jgi:hypothetical protein
MTTMFLTVDDSEQLATVFTLLDSFSSFNRFWFFYENSISSYVRFSQRMSMGYLKLVMLSWFNIQGLMRQKI